MAVQILDGVRVVDLSAGPVGGVATMVLADHGADVIKVEPPGGDRFRGLASAPLWLRGKRSIVLDLTNRPDIESLSDLITTADVLVVSGPPSRSQRWGVTFEAAATRRPNIIYCSITGWGRGGPLAEIPAYEGVIAARGGRMLALQRQLLQGRPVFSALPVAGHATAQGAVQGILAALFARLAGEEGPQHVETSMIQGLLPYDLVELLLVELASRQGVALPSMYAAGGVWPTLNYLPMRAADGRWIQCGNLLEHLLMACLDAMGLLEELLVDERFQVPPGEWSAETVDVVRDMMLKRALTRTADDWMEAFRSNGNVAAEIFATTEEALHHPDILANGGLVELDDPLVGRVQAIGALAEFAASPPQIDRAAPLIGAHNAEILGALTCSPPSRSPSPPPASRSAAPLRDITIVEFATIIAAPLSTAMLADLGARVIRVEAIGGDPYRHLASDGSGAVKTTAGKESICVNLKAPEGRALAQRLALEADVVVHNYRPGVAERLGLGESDLRCSNPSLVWVSITGYGRHGPGARRPSTHPCAGAATGGAFYQSGNAIAAEWQSLDELRELSRQLIRANDSNPDPNTSVVAATATLLALLHRKRTGQGQAVYVDMMTANLYANSDDALIYEGKLPRQPVDSGLHGLSATYRLYQAMEGWVFLAVTSDDEWERFGRAIGDRSMIGDLRFATVESRWNNEEELSRQLASLFSTRSADDWAKAGRLEGVGLVRADGATPGVFFSTDPQALENGLAPECVHSRFGTHRRWGPIVTVNGGLASYGPGVLAGQHTDPILDELGLDSSDLRARGVVGSEDLSSLQSTSTE